MKQDRYQVLKFGGSCLSSPEDFANAAGIAASYEMPVIVVSAVSGVTESLLELCRAANPVEAMEKINNIQRVHIYALGRIRRKRLAEPSMEELRQLFQDLISLVMGNLKSPSEEKQALILSYGERLSAVIMKWHLLNLNKSPEVVYSNEIIVSRDESFMGSDADELWSKELVRHRISRLESEGRIPVITGFFCRTPSGKTAILGRNSSDYTAALVSSALIKCSLTFWKDVPGLMTGDPKFVKECRVLRQITYEEAETFISNGAKILHRKVIDIAREKEVPIRIRDFRNPGNPGTIISRSVEQSRKADSA